MNDLVYTICEPAKDTGIRDVKAEGVAPCPLCHAKHEDYHTRNVWVYVRTEGSSYTAVVHCLHCGLHLERCSGGHVAGSFDDAIRRVLAVWNNRESAGGAE